MVSLCTVYMQCSMYPEFPVVNDVTCVHKCGCGPVEGLGGGPVEG